MRAVGVEWGEGNGGMFTSVLLGHCFRDGVGGFAGGRGVVLFKRDGGLLGRTSGGARGG